jgi:chemotaxis protein methyltransferase CheR
MDSFFCHILQFLNQDENRFFKKFDENFLLNSMKTRQNELQIVHLDSYLAYLQSDIQERELLKKSLLVTYSIFFRNTLTFTTLEYLVIPQLILSKSKQKSVKLKIWCTASASGQEPYSYAMLMESIKRKYSIPFEYNIFATDIDPVQIKNAQQGVYSEESIQNVPFHLFSKWFSRVDNYFIIDNSLKENIHFSVFDLFDQRYSAPPESIFGGFDIIVCCNLLFYYNQEYRKLLMDKFQNNSLNNSILITGEVERDILIQHKFSEIYPESSIFKFPQKKI